VKELSNCTGFQWDEHNADKIWDKHSVTRTECEQLFFNQPLIVADDTKHSKKEKRYYVLGQTGTGRRLYLIFTTRKLVVRVISARDMSRKERRVYEKS
jgi:uncharacterized DUF497 family protein